MGLRGKQVVSLEQNWPEEKERSIITLLDPAGCDPFQTSHLLRLD